MKLRFHKSRVALHTRHRREETKNPARSRQPRGGFGLGLTLCYQLVKGHHGTISVESDPGTGSTFYVHLPRIE